MANTIVFKTQKEDGSWKSWRNIAIPVRYGTLLDEQLDYAVVTLSRIKRKEFKPMTRADLVITSATEYGGVQEKTYQYFIASDEAYETPVGSGVYQHELTLVELTKYLECFPLESLCFTTPNAGSKKVSGSRPTLQSEFSPAYANETIIDGYYASDYETPSLIGTTFKLLPVKSGLSASPSLSSKVRITQASGVTEYELKDGNFGDKEFTIESGENIITYELHIPASTYLTYTETSTFTIVGVESKVLPLKPWTVNEVIQRVLSLVEPIRLNERPRFSFSLENGGNVKKELFAQLAPEFTFTRMTLREALQAIGSFIHAEPRLVIETVEGVEKYQIIFDSYGEQEYATITNYKEKHAQGDFYIPKRLSETKYRALQNSLDIEQSCTNLDSYQENLVNRLAWDRGTVEQPYGLGAQTLRTEAAYARAEDASSFYFPTTQGIDRVVKFEYIDEDGEGHDITQYVYEEKIYNALSSYEGTYPSSKAYALYYSQGKNGINGMFFKNNSALANGAFEKYAIVNILGKVVDKFPDKYNQLRFRLSYVPVYSTRVRQSKPYLNEYLSHPRILNYSQTDNSVEARYFGENIKGAIARMGNPERAYTINLRNVNNIPQAGKLWDDDYYIASVSVSVNQDLFEVSCGLSKNFNRKSKYIGASSIKRVYEVSEEMVQQRHTIYNDYIVLTKSPLGIGEFRGGKQELLLNSTGLKAIANIFSFFDYQNYKEISCVLAQGSTKKNTPKKRVLLPVIASSFGNAMEFTWEYKDNFSAGLQLIYKKVGEVEGKFGYEVEYADSYGRIWSYWFSLMSDSQLSEGNASANEDLLPEAKGVDGKVLSDTYKYVSSGDFLERKDSREALKKSYVIEFVTDEPSIIIGSAFASRNPLVYNEGPNYRKPHLCIFKEKLNKFSSVVDQENILSEIYIEDEKLGISYENVSADSDNYAPPTFTISGIAATKAGKAWAYITPIRTIAQYAVEDEDGDASPMNIQDGGEIIIGENIDFAEGDTIGSFSGCAVHDVFKYLEAKNKIKE